MAEGLRPGVARIDDVAALAGVSKSTVSKALNGKGEMRAETRARVQRAAESLKFRPNPLAQGLLSGRSYTVGLLTTDDFGRFSLPIMLGAENALGADEIAVLLCDSRADPRREQRYLRMLLDRRVDALIVTGRRTEPRPPLAVGPVPVVYAFQPSADPADCSVVADHAGGARTAVDRLLATDRRCIAHVTGPRRHRSAVERARAAAAALAARGLRAVAAPGYGAWSEAWGREFTTRLLRTCPDVDGIFCGSDQIARGVLETLKEEGRDVPGDVAVVGFDNWRVMAEGSRPPLTTVDMNLERIGAVSASLLLAAIDGRSTSGTTTVPTALVVRDSA